MLGLLFCHTLLTAASIGLAPVQQGDLWFAGDDRLKIALDATDGSFREVWVAGQPVFREVGEQQTFDLNTMNGWLTGTLRQTPELLSVTATDAGIAAEVRCGPWQFRFDYGLDPARLQLRRRASFTWHGNGPTRFYGFWLRSPVTLLDGGDNWFCPGVWPPVRHRAEDRVPGRKSGGAGLPASCIVQLDPALSAVWITDDRQPVSDRSSVSVTEHVGGLFVAQSFQCQGRIDVGETQTVGDAWLYFTPTDGEGALRGLHDWMRQVGHTIPADRPEWLPHAALYSLDASGTIASSWRDLGGFVPATRLLDSIAELGCNALWILPVEDVSPYHPRDYYAFRQGLGTPDEYRALVAGAHERGLHVLQDIVPHGGSNTYPRALEHPEWLAQEEDGSTLPYWCFDFNWPSWQEYMAGVAAHYVREYGVDGYRVDATSGSKIPNWNPAIPYARASQAQLQGGLGMLRALRGAVKAEKPADGGLLAETGGSLYGTVADAVYDFTACYTVFHGIRKMPAAEFVPLLRRWLHEQQFAEAEDLIRLRHLESHDSLRSAGWYGIDGLRAMFAMDAWIQGLPMIYQEMETGQRFAFRQILEAREALPELRRGVPDYVSAEAPESVFAVLRTLGEQVSVALINFSEKPVRGALRIPLDALPEAVRATAQASDLFAGTERPLRVADGALQGDLSLAPLGYTVWALRPASAAPTLTRAPDWPVAPVPGDPPADAGATLAGLRYRAELDPATGLPRSLTVAGQAVLGAASLALDPATAARAGEPQLRAAGADWLVELPFGEARLTLRYHPTPERLEIRGSWAGPAPVQCALVWPVNDATRWSATASEGRLEDQYQVRHLTTEGVMGNTNWQAQGTAVVFDSLLQPFGADGGEISAEAGGQPVSLQFAGRTLPARVQWLDRVGDDHRLTATVALRDPEAPVDGLLPLALEVVPAPPRPAADSTLRPSAGGWIYQNAHYRLELGRNGLVRTLSDGKGRTLLRNLDLYTDQGYGADRTRYAAGNDVETAIRFSPDGSGLRLRFEGRLRDFQRFGKLSPAIRYRVDYTLGAGPSLRVSTAVQPTAEARGGNAFLATIGHLPELSRITFQRAGETLGEADIVAGQRVLETRPESPAEAPDTILLESPTGRLLTISALTVTTPTRPNLFTYGQQVFVAWQDGEAQPTGAPQWLSTTALWTPGEASPVALGQAPAYPEAGAASRLLDPGFEAAAGARLTLWPTGTPLPRLLPDQAWEIPIGGRPVGDPVHSGSAAAEVVGVTEGYRLWLQPLAGRDFTPGSRWRVSAWMKGEGIAFGPLNWQVPTLRFVATLDGKPHYFSAGAPAGTFDWQPVVLDWTVPDGVTAVEVQVGQNGSSGTLWIDDLTLEPLGDAAGPE